MKISIITICLNAEKEIERTIKSVLNQTYKDIEYIIIDGGSKDKTLEIINNYKISWAISEKDNGRYHAMNKGIRLAPGDLIMILNAGDIYLNEFVIENIINKINKIDWKADVYFGDIIHYRQDGSSKYITFNSEGNHEVNLNSLYLGFIPHPATIYRKEAFIKNGLFNENNQIISDWEWCVKAHVENKIQFKYIGILAALFYAGGISNINKPLMVKEKLPVIEKYYK